MRLLVIIILIVLALMVLIMPLFKGKKPSLATFAFLLIPIVGLGYLEYTWTEDQKKLEQVYQTATGISVAKMSCERMSTEWFDAYVTEKTSTNSTGARSVLKHSGCAPLIKFINLEDKSTQTMDNTFVEGVMVFSEEVIRLRSPELPDERKRCNALKAIPEMTAALGGTTTQGIYVQEYYKQVMKNKKLTIQAC